MWSQGHRKSFKCGGDFYEENFYYLKEGFILLNLFSVRNLTSGLLLSCSGPGVCFVFTGTPPMSV